MAINVSVNLKINLLHIIYMIIMTVDHVRSDALATFTDAIVVTQVHLDQELYQT
jgi:hypothetical protein